MKVYLQALGCKTNQYEVEAVGQLFVDKGFTVTDDLDAADIYILNTCSVTSEAGRKSKQILRRYKHHNSEGLVVAMGCHAQLTDLRDVADVVCGTDNRALVVDKVLDKLNITVDDKADKEIKLEDLASCPNEEVGISRAAQYEELGIVRRQLETRAQVKIQDGCNLRCSYCAITLARGRSRSRRRSDILQEARSLVVQGTKEIVLTGIHICSFESELGRDATALAELCLELSEIEGLERIRLGSLEPLSVTPEVVELWSQSTKLCPHFHLSLQSGSDNVLAKMRRRYTAAQYLEVVDRLRTAFPRCAFTSDVMVAFPTETVEDFNTSLDFVRTVGFSRIHVFRYSPRANTPAASWPQIDKAESVRRGAEMQALGDELAYAYGRSFIGDELEFLVEKIKDGVAEGYSRNYLRGSFFAPDAKQGKLYRVKIANAAKDLVFGSLIS